MFRSSTIIRELALNLAKVIFTLKHSVKLGRYLLCGCVAACKGMACVLYAVHSAQYTTHTHHIVKVISMHIVRVFSCCCNTSYAEVGF